MIKQVIIICSFILFSGKLFSQIDGNSVMGIPSIALLTDATGATPSVAFKKGNIVFVEDQNTYYYFDGTKWIALLNAENKNIIENELFFEDANYYYVSVRVNTTDWMVSRFSRTDLNTEAFAMGTGTQPADLTTVTGLTYL